MATYKQIQNHVRTQHNFTPKTCWIADVLSSYGLTTRVAANRRDPSKREYPCPIGKRAAIEQALKQFRMI